MKHSIVLTGIAASLTLWACGPADEADAADARDAADQPEERAHLVIHGGAGAMSRDNMTDETEAAYRAALMAALEAGHAVLDGGGTSLDAVIAAVRLMEDDSLFNAGRGAVFTADGANELDASLMDGATREAGAVAGVTRVRNPIELARLVMEESPHVMMAREGAEAFGEEHGVEMVSEDYFRTGSRWEALERAREQASRGTPDESFALGTVGAAAVDRNGNLAAATTTGGMTNKMYGRIGDSPIIGAGTYADNETCAVSSTGHGEYFIRNVVAYDICAMMSYSGISLREAADEVIMNKLPDLGGTGGVIAIDRDGNFAMPYNTGGMYRGWIDEDGQATVLIWDD